MFRSLLIFTVILVSNTLVADISSSDYNSCKVMTDSLKRLLCYDNLKSITKKDVIPITQKDVTPIIQKDAELATIPLVIPPQPVMETTNNTTTPVNMVANQSDIGNWNVDVDIVNPEDYSENKATAVLLANAVGENSSTKPILKIHCNSKKTKVYVNWGTPIGIATSYEMFIGTEKFPTRRWSRSKNKKSSYYPKSPLYLLKQMFKSDSLDIVINLRDGSTMKTSFDTTGMRKAIEPIRRTCEW